MENNISLELYNYEKDFLSLQGILPELRNLNPNQFIAFKNGKVISAGNSVEEIKKNLQSQGIEPSGTVIEFISKNEIKVIV